MLLYLVRPFEDSLLSEPLANHDAAVDLGNRVAEHGISVYEEWRGPIDTIFEWAHVIANPLGGIK